MTEQINCPFCGNLIDRDAIKCENCDAYIPYHCHPKQSSYEEVKTRYEAWTKEYPELVVTEEDDNEEEE